MQPARSAEPDDLDVLHEIEKDADQLFAHAFGAVPWSDPPTGPDRSAQPGFILVAGRPAVGFTHLLDRDGHAHLEQLSVTRFHQRLGLGGLLLEATAQEARRRGYDQLTLCTCDGLGWNAPLYGRHGFIEISEAEIATMPHLAPLRAAERAERLDSYGRRIVRFASWPPEGSLRTSPKGGGKTPLQHTHAERRGWPLSPRGCGHVGSETRAFSGHRCRWRKG